jgi:hypothetical protein
LFREARSKATAVNSGSVTTPLMRYSLTLVPSGVKSGP